MSLGLISKMMPFSPNRLSFEDSVETVRNSWNDILAIVIINGMKHKMGTTCYNSPLDLTSKKFPPCLNMRCLGAIH